MMIRKKRKSFWALSALVIILTMLFGMMPLATLALTSEEGDLTPPADNGGGDIVFVESPEVPLALIFDQGTWALLNLLLCVAGGLLAILMSLRILTARRQEEDERSNRDKMSLLVVSILAIVGIMLFILTQNMRLEFVLVDWWTAAHAALLIGAILIYIISSRRDKDKDTTHTSRA